ncbi:MAG: hypothetical protein CM15mP6_3900 [Methanobacteriota archaeon]|nr:MAG: hypothetical protein CM15mP6_3900 [Euryarchaeota archaeon]
MIPWERTGCGLLHLQSLPVCSGSEPRIEDAANVARSKGLGFVGINSNDPVKYESDSWENMVKRANKGMSYPTSTTQHRKLRLPTVRRGTPEFYLLNNESIVVLQGSPGRLS